MPRCEPANAIDVQIGRNIARRRVSMGLSQAALGGAVGISFQQVQKYETGANRVACSRLYRMAEVLKCAPADLLPSAEWGVVADPCGPALDECARLLAQVQPAIEAALRIAKGRPHDRT